MRILVADDDFASRTMLQRFLEDYGDVDVVVNGAEAVTAFTLALDNNQPYGLVCLDVMMPEMDGVTALGRIRIKEKSMKVASDKEVKIIMTTSLEFYKDSLTIGHKHLVRCNDYITKPIDLDKLAEILEKYGFSK
ncbi:response regulator [Candidatus Magnetomonas plexicatena]|uniref:response regulator n=1 Tax=Candidatus Magnetomonas plexicatena TaxID=2552947 RepID=UPI001C7844C7|nr:response regulator [Nitrospirales bacterium LBB_01]